jgi:hypothetical protein
MFRVLPPFGGDQRATAEIVNGIMNGKTNNTGKVTLATSWATTTTITDARIGIDSVILLIPSSDAAESDAAPYGCFTNNSDQLSPSVGSTAVVVYDTTEEASGVFLSNSSRLNVRNYGIYNVQFSLQLVNNSNAPEYADVWFRLNGTDVPRSASRFDVPARKSAGVPSHIIGTVNTFIEMQAGDYVQIAGTTSSTDVTLEHYAADTGIPRPAIPAVITTVQYIAPLSSGNVYISSQTNGSAVVSHFANDTASKTYKYIVVG